MSLIPPWNCLNLARADIAARGIPTDEIDAILADIGNGSGGDPLPPELEPYFIPNDLSLCTATSILNCSHVDRELDLPAGFSIEAAATRRNAFGKPYYIDPVKAVRRCAGLFALERFEDLDSWEYDLAFIGHKGKYSERGRYGLLADTSNTRFIFLEAFAQDYLSASPARIHFRCNEEFFFADPTETAEQRERRNMATSYIGSVRDSRFVLCPRGGGPNSIRFFETLACANVPVYIGDRATKFPLDWVIDWSQMCFRISCEEVADGSYRERLDEILATPLSEVNRRRRYIFRIYHQFLAPERKEVFEYLVLLRTRQLLRAGAGPAT